MANSGYSVSASRLYSQAVLTWLVIQIASSMVNSVWAEWSISVKNVAASIFISTLMAVVQVRLTASLLWKMKPKHRITSIVAGAGLGFVIPILLYLLIGPLSWIADFGAFILWMLLRCSFSILVVGLIGGAGLGYVRSKVSVALDHG